MLDWCRCVCKRAGQHQCFDSGSSAPIISPPAAEPLPPAACPCNPSPPTSPPPLLSFFLRFSCICLSSSLPPPLLLSVPLLYPEVSVCLALPRAFSLVLHAAPIAPSLSSRGRNFLRSTPTTPRACTTDTYRYGLPFTVDYIRNLTGGPVHFRNYCINF